MSLDHPEGQPSVPQEDGPPVRVLTAVIRDGGRYLLFRRASHQRYGGPWEFPGGKIEPGEMLLQAATREVKEELGLDVIAVEEAVLSRRDPASPFIIEFMTVQVRGTPQALEHEEIRWVSAREVASFGLPPSDRVFWGGWVTRERGAGL